MRPAPGLVLLGLATASCAQILGLDDPAGRLEGGGGTGISAGTGAVTGSVTGSGTSTGGGGAGAGGAATSTGGGAGSTSSTGTGGGLVTGGALELPQELTVQVLGRSPIGAVALVKAETGAGTLCDTTVEAERLAAVSIVTSACAVLGQVQGPDDSLQGVSIVRVGDWLGLSGIAAAGALTLHTPSQFPASLAVEAGGFFGAWNITAPEEGFFWATVERLDAGAILPAGDGPADLFMRSVQLGFDPPRGDCSEAEPASSRVHVTYVTSGEGCARVATIPGALLDAGRATESWMVTGGGGVGCIAISANIATTDRSLGACIGDAHLLVHDEGRGDLTFAGLDHSTLCPDDRPGIVEGIAEQSPRLVWCDPEDAEVRVIPFHVDATHLYFLRADATSADLLKVPREGGEAELSTGLCSACTVKDAVAANGAVFVIGTASAPIELFGQDVGANRSFWAWADLADL